MLALRAGAPVARRVNGARWLPNTRTFIVKVDGKERIVGLPPKHGLYDPRNEKDSCGVGFVVDIGGAKTHSTVQQGLEALTHLDHRGATSADALTGDGVGLLTQIPHLFFRKKLAARGIALARDEDMAVGVFFLPGGKNQASVDAAATMVAKINAAAADAGLEVLMWRRVPIGEYALGKSARDTMPDIRQAVFRRPPALRSTSPDVPAGEAADAAFERLLYLTRKRLERELATVSNGEAPFYVPSLSHRTIVYKGLVVAPNLRHLFPDLNDSDYHSALALFHQRYSTNTHPMWFNAQPFRMLAHNGEINTLQGNVNWMRMREETMASELFGNAANFRDLLPVIQAGGSDSAMLDNVLELLVQCGRTPLQAMAMLVPEAYEGNKVMDSHLRAFYDYQRTLMEPWDGPAALAFTDGRTVAAALDRNGLRPLRYWLTSGGKLIAGSEVGIVEVAAEHVVERGRLGPGDMLAVDTERGVFSRNDAIKAELAGRRPYQAWLERSITHVQAERSGLGQVMSYATLMGVLGPAAAAASAGDAPVPERITNAVHARVRQKKAFGYSKEDEELILRPMAEAGHEPIGSMGDDTPLAAFSAKPQLLYRYFKQRFAEVTNPPIDPLLERSTMSLAITFGRKGKLLAEDQGASFLLRLPSPIVTEAQMDWLTTHREFGARTLRCLWDVERGPEGLAEGVATLCAAAAKAVEEGVSYLKLSDRGVDEKHAPIPMLLAVGAVHHHLIRAKNRMRASLLVETGEAREDHHVAALISYGASAVHPYLAYETVAELAAARAGEPGAPTVEAALGGYRKALQDGLLRIMSKMGISTVDSYRGAQVFETLGLGQDVVDLAFDGTPNSLPTVSLTQLGADSLAFHAAAYGEAVTDVRGSFLPRSGAYATVKGGEFHAYNPLVFNKLRTAAQAARDKTGPYERYAAEVDGRPLTSLRDALDLVKAPTPTPLELVESAESIVKRFSTQAMSHGSISREAHEALAIAANRVGSRSNTGEGGEDPSRYTRYTAAPEGVSHSESWRPQAGDDANSRIKQVASARFGVTPTYLINAQQLEIKMAQGSKPGEGGHIPGHKVNAEIAKNRYAQVGVTLISPPPHHDIYSIEDLAQLIYDCKRVNADAQVVVKLVSQAGVGTIAAGVVKAFADVIQISGNDGGTGASPLASIKNAGLPWELGLAETQAVLVANGLRDRVTLRVDGGLKDGRDVVLAALLGGEQFGFGTAALVALGCVMARKCHLNTCPVGIATQNPELRKKFKGTPDHVVTFLLHTAEQVRRVLSELGLKSVDEAVGRIDLLKAKSPKIASFPKGVMDVSALLANPYPPPVDGAPLNAGRKAKDMLSRANPDFRAPILGTANDGRDLDQIVWSTTQPFVDAVSARLARGEALAPVAAPAPGAEEEEADDLLVLHFPIKNAARSVGARLSGEIARRRGVAGLPDTRIVLRFHGVAGQSFGAFCNRGMKLVLRGEAHDYVAKSMYGGVIALAPQSTPTVAIGPDGAAAAPAPLRAAAAAAAGLDAMPPTGPRENVIAGNTVLYGATGGRLFAAGRAGERFAVRNSGATAVVEGVGHHGCEYMTNGCVVVLGSVGRNFGAGMSGGEAFVLDVADTFLDRYNPGMIAAGRLALGGADEARLLALVREHVAETGSAYGAHVLANWAEARELVWHVLPNTTPMKANSQALVHVPNWSRRGAAAPVAQPVSVGVAPLTLAVAPQKVGQHAAPFSTAAGRQVPLA